MTKAVVRCCPNHHWWNAGRSVPQKPEGFLGHVRSHHCWATELPCRCICDSEAEGWSLLSHQKAGLAIHVAFLRPFICSCHSTSARCWRPFRRTLGRAALTIM